MKIILGTLLCFIIGTWTLYLATSEEFMPVQAALAMSGIAVCFCALVSLRDYDFD